MENYCALNGKTHKCIIWTDYIVTRFELEEANELCHGNWIEIQRKDAYIRQLQRLLDQHNIEYPMD